MAQTSITAPSRFGRHPARAPQPVSPCPRDAERRSGRSGGRPPGPGRGTAGDAGATTLWWALITRSGGRNCERSLVAVNSDEFPDGTAVDVTGRASADRPAGWVVDVRYRGTDGTPLEVAVAGSVGGSDLPLWFVARDDGSGLLPATSLLAFHGGGFAPGQVVAPPEAAARGLGRQHSVGEIRWNPRSGVVDTVVVDEAARGRGVGRHLVTAAEGLRTLRGWPPLRSDGRLTEVGAHWLAGCPAWWRTRLAARTERLPASTPSTELRGVTRLLA